MNYFILTFLFLLLYSNSISCPRLLFDINFLLNYLLTITFFRLIFLFIIIANTNIVYSVILSIIFILVMNNINNNKITESFEQIEEYKNI
jgi:hypothetical protein